MNLSKEHKNCECHTMLKSSGICMPNKCHVIHEDDLVNYTDLINSHNTLQALYDSALKQLRKYEVLQYSPKELEIELNRGTNNIVVIQNVEEFVDKQLLHGSHVSDGLLKILKGKA